MGFDRIARTLLVIGTLAVYPFIADPDEHDGDEQNDIPEFRSDLIYKGLVKDIADARALTDLIYYHQLSAPIEQSVRLNNQNKLALFKYRCVRDFRRSYYRYQDDKGQDKIGVIADTKRTVAQKNIAVEIYKNIIEKLDLDRKNGKRTDAPIELLGVLYPMVSKIKPQDEDVLIHLHKEYWRKPSDLALLAQLEISLLKKDLGGEEEYRDLIDDAIKKMNIEKFDFRSDVGFRKNISESSNFVRPEPCLLFLAAENAHRDGKSEDAQKYFKILVERAPGSPFAWEALARLSIMSGVDQAEFGRLKQELLKTYPLIWGCPRPEIKLDKEEFEKHLDELLKNAGEEGTKDFRKSQQ